ncbi:MAG TPA: FUSC family membrane protein [Paenalcaligenes sp.]|nr:FUSC family membrane protein [Paenalcaligenes sp.]
MRLLTKLSHAYYRYQFYSSLRQATGALLPAVLFAGYLHQFALGVSMTVGAFCLAMIDQFGGRRKDRVKELWAASGFCTLVALISSFASGYPVLLFMTVALVCFSCAMLNVFGPRWGLIALSGLFVMILNVRVPTHGSEVLLNTLYTFLGTVFYLLYTLLVRRFTYLNEERRAVYGAYLNTATYMQKRAALYDMQTDLDAAYQHMFTARAAMTAQFQTACDVLLSDFAKRRQRNQSEHAQLELMLVHAIKIADTMIATQTDYKALRAHLGHSAFITLCQRTIAQLGDCINTLADAAVHKNKPLAVTLPTETLRAMSAELNTYHAQGHFDNAPHTRVLMLQIMRRIRKVYFIVADILRLHEASSPHTDPKLLDTADTSIHEVVQSSPSSAISPQKPFSWKLLINNLNLGSPNFRYALRLSIAGLLGLLVPLALASIFSDQLLHSAFTQRSYWILLTLVLVMKPGFTLTRERNKRRLIGTLIGCAIAFLLFKIDPSNTVYFLIMWLLYTLALCFLPINYLYGATFVTVFVMIAFYFLHESGTFVIEERLVDTLVGCTLALILSYFLPSWEATSIQASAQGAIDANTRLLKSTLRMVDKTTNEAPATRYEDWKKANIAAELALNNFSAAFQRMMSEPAAHQFYVAEYNRIMVQLFVIYAQIANLEPARLANTTVSTEFTRYLESAIQRLQKQPSGTLPALSDDDLGQAMNLPLLEIAAAAETVKNSLLAIDKQAANGTRAKPQAA